MMKPPIGGPTTGAAIAGQVIVEMACIMRLFSVLRTTMSRPTGTIIAPPMPCSRRAAVNSATFCDSPHSTDATVNTPIALKNTVREPQRSAIQPLAGMKMASASM
ncbi:hypothetical protein ABIE53_005900 [Burkholderia sp. OAS925]